MIDEKKITLNEAVRSYHKGHLQIPIFRAFVTKNYSLKELSSVKPAHFESLQALLERKILSEEHLFGLDRQPIDDLANFGGLIVNNVCSLEQLLLLTKKQSQHLHVIRSIAGKSSLLINANVPLEFFFESENGQVIADKMQLLLANQRLTLEDVFSMPSFGVKFNYLDNRFCTLITHGRMSINFEPTDDLFEKLKFDGVYQLFLNGTLAFEQLAELTERQCNQLEDHVTREQVVVGELSLAQIPESEKKQIFNKGMRFFNPGPKCIETASASNKRVTIAP